MSEDRLTSAVIRCRLNDRGTILDRRKHLSLLHYL